MRGRRRVSVSPRLTAAFLDRLALALGRSFAPSRSGLSPRSRKPIAVNRPPAASGRAAASASAAAQHPVRARDEPRSVAAAAQAAGSRPAAPWAVEVAPGGLKPRAWGLGAPGVD